MNSIVKWISTYFRSRSGARYRRLRRLNWQKHQEFLSFLSRLEHDFVESDIDGFRKMLSLARTHLHGDTEDIRRFQYLPKTLEANQFYAENHFGFAWTNYRDAIKDIESIRQDLLSKSARVKDKRYVDYFTVILALLKCNLAKVMERLNQNPEEVTTVFQEAHDLQPQLGYVGREMALYFQRNHLWEESERWFRHAYQCEPDEENEKNLRLYLTNLLSEQVEILFTSDKLDEAVQVVNRGILKATEGGLLNWEGRFRYRLATCLQLQEQNEQALNEFRAGMDCYARAEYFESASYLSELQADLLVAMKRDVEARAGYEEALRYAEKPKGDNAQERDKPPAQNARRRARLLTRIGVLELLAGRLLMAREKLEKSHDLVPKKEWFNPFGRLVDEAGPLLDRDDLLTVFKLYLHSELQKETPTERRRNLIDALRRLFDRSGRLVTEDHEQAWQMADNEFPVLNVVTPIAVEIDLHTLGKSGGEKEIIDIFAPAMRERIQQKFGVKVPGIRLRGNETDLPSGAYIIMIHEVPRVSGTLLHTAGGVVLAAEADLKTAEVEPKEQVEASWIEDAFWIGEESLERARKADLEIWTPLEYMIRHVEAVLSEQLVEFVAHQEVQNHLEDAGLVSTDRLEELICRESKTHMAPLTRLVRGLVAERVPIDDVNLVHRVFSKGQAQGLSTEEIAQCVRLKPKVRDRLWGNDESYQFVLLDHSVVELLEKARSDPLGDAIALDPEKIQKFLANVREVIGGLARSAIVVPSQGGRAPVRAALEIEFPNVPVLSLAELKPGLGSKIEFHVGLDD